MSVGFVVGGQPFLKHAYSDKVIVLVYGRTTKVTNIPNVQEESRVDKNTVDFLFRPLIKKGRCVLVDTFAGKKRTGCRYDVPPAIVVRDGIETGPPTDASV